MNRFYQVYYPIPCRDGHFIWFPYKIYHSRAYAVKVMTGKINCFAIVSNPYAFCDDSEKKVYIYGNYHFYSGLTLDHFINCKNVCFV